MPKPEYKWGPVTEEAVYEEHRFSVTQKLVVKSLHSEICAGSHDIGTSPE